MNIFTHIFTVPELRARVIRLIILHVSLSSKKVMLFLSIGQGPKVRDLFLCCTFLYYFLYRVVIPLVSLNFFVCISTIIRSFCCFLAWTTAGCRWVYSLCCLLHLFIYLATLNDFFFSCFSFAFLLSYF